MTITLELPDRVRHFWQTPSRVAPPAHHSPEEVLASAVPVGAWPARLDGDAAREPGHGGAGDPVGSDLNDAAVDAAIRRSLLESFAAEMYRTRRWGTRPVRELLQLETRWETIAFLSERGLYPNYDADDLEQDLRQERILRARLAAETGAVVPGKPSGG